MTGQLTGKRRKADRSARPRPGGKGDSGQKAVKRPLENRRVDGNSPGRLKIVALGAALALPLLLSGYILLSSLMSPCCETEVTLSLNEAGGPAPGQADKPARIAGALAAVSSQPGLAPSFETTGAGTKAGSSENMASRGSARTPLTAPEPAHIPDVDPARYPPTIHEARDLAVEEQILASDGVYFLEPYISPEARKERQAAGLPVREPAPSVSRQAQAPRAETRTASARETAQPTRSSRATDPSYQASRPAAPGRNFTPVQKASLTRPPSYHRPVPVARLEARVRNMQDGTVVQGRNGRASPRRAASITPPSSTPPAKPAWLAQAGSSVSATASSPVTAPSASRTNRPAGAWSSRDPIKAAGSNPGAPFEQYQDQQRDILIVRDPSGRLQNILVADGRNRSVASSADCTTALADARKRKAVPTMLIARCNATGVREIRMPQQQGMLPEGPPSPRPATK